MILIDYNNITLDEFKHYYEYLFYNIHNIDKFIQNEKTYTKFMEKQQKKFPEIKQKETKIYYIGIMRNLKKEFNKFYKQKKEILRKLNLIIDIFETYEKICKFEQELKKLKVEISKTTKYKDEYSKLVQREKHLKDTIIGNGSNVLFPISMSLKQKEEYLKNNYLKYRLIDKIRILFNMSVIKAKVVIRKKKFFNYCKKNCYSITECRLKKEKVLSIFEKCLNIEKFMNEYQKIDYYCPVCPYKNDNELTCGLHLCNEHMELCRDQYFCNVCPIIYKIKVHNGHKCPYCPQIFDKTFNSNDILNHIKINHIFNNVKDIDEIISKFNDKISEKKICKKLMIKVSNNNFSNKMKKVSILQKKCNNVPTFSFAYKLKHDYRLLFKKPNSYLNIAELEEKIKEFRDENKHIHYVNDKILNHCEKILFKKIYKLTKKIIGKSYFKNVLPNFGYKTGFMTVENEIINLIHILKNDLKDVISENIYGNTSEYGWMIKEFSDSFELIIDFFSRHLESITSIQTLINNNIDTSKYEQNLEKCYEILKSDIDFTNKLLPFLFKLMKILEQFSKLKKYQRLSSLKKILMPEIEYNSNMIDNYNENKEDIDINSFSLLLSYLDKSEHTSLVDNTFEVLIPESEDNPRTDKAYIWTWEYSLNNVSKTEFYKNFNVDPYIFKESRDSFLNILSNYEKSDNEKNIDENFTNFSFLIDSLNKIYFKEEIYDIYRKVKEILSLFSKMNTSMITNNNIETFKSFSVNRLTYYNKNTDNVERIKETNINKCQSKLFKMRKMILHQNIHLLIVMSLLNNILTEDYVEEDSSNTEDYHKISLSYFIKRYFQTFSMRIKQQNLNNPLPSFVKQKKSKLKKSNKENSNQKKQTDTDVSDDEFEFEYDTDIENDSFENLDDDEENQCNDGYGDSSDKDNNYDEEEV